MKPITQTKVSSEDGSVSGNCFRACIASILEIDIDSIPAFEDMKGGEWHMPFFKFLSENGYEFHGTGRFDNEFHDELFKTYEGVDGYIIVNGTSPRKWVTRGHSVVYKNGVMVHDPHPSREGLVDLRDYYMIEKRKDV